MFTWLRRLLRRRAVASDINDNEVERLKQILALVEENPNASEVSRMLARDVEDRILRPPGGGRSSSPISSS